MVGRLVGTSLPRREDVPLLRGETRFIADLAEPMLDNAAHVVFVRSPHAHARIVSIDVDHAESAHGVLDVVTASDHEVVPRHSVFPQYYDAVFAMPLLAEDIARYVGQPVVAVVAETVADAVDAAELVEVEYEPLSAVIDVNDAVSDRTVLFPRGSGARLKAPIESDYSGTNVCLRHVETHPTRNIPTGPVVVNIRVENPRQLPTPIEPLGQACAWTDDGELHIWAATQRPHGFREQLADLYELDESTIHVTAPEGVGGAFGGKVSRLPEEHALPMLARRIGRPLRWLQTSSEYFQGATQGRGEQIDVVLEGDEFGRLIALRTDMLKDSGAYPGVGGNLPTRFNSVCAGGPYAFDHVEFGAVSVVTNAPQVSAFRGAGRGPYLAALERAVDVYARRINVDPVEVRRRSLVRAEHMPYRSTTGAVYDEADYVGDMDKALVLADYDGLRAEQAARRVSGASWQLGIGVATYHLMTVGGGGEEATVTIDRDGSAAIRTGTSSQGHGHDSTWAQIAADALAIDVDEISVFEGSTHHTDTGVGAVGSRSLQTAGIAIQNASLELVELARSVAARLLEADQADIVVDRIGPMRFHVAGVPAKSVGWAEVVQRMERETGHDMTCGDIHDVGDNNSFPSGCHIAVVEVDTSTGEVRLCRFIGVDDVGVRVNPMIVEGQLHGGIVAGIGQVLGEVMRYDDDGNPLTTNLADYMLASIDLVPRFELVASETPTSFNALGVKGVGESGTVGAVPAMHNAIIDAVSYLGIEHIDLPCTPERVWNAIERASG